MPRIWLFDDLTVQQYYCLAVKLNIHMFQALIRALLQKWKGFSDVFLCIWKRLVSADRIDCRAELSEEKYPELLLTLYNFAGETNHVINLTQVTSKYFSLLPPLSSLPTLLNSNRVPQNLFWGIFENTFFRLMENKNIFRTTLAFFSKSSGFLGDSFLS